MKYNIGDELWYANYQICKTSNNVFILEHFARKVEIERIKISKAYGRFETGVTYETSNGISFKENDSLNEIGLFIYEKEAKKAAKEKVKIAAKLEIRNYESIIKDKQRRVKELKQAIKEL
jgi:hypothetical protein